MSKVAPSDILNGRKPSIIAFDCDWTLYPYDCDKDRIPPFEGSSHGVTETPFNKLLKCVSSW